MKCGDCPLFMPCRCKSLNSNAVNGICAMDVELSTAEHNSGKHLNSLAECRVEEIITKVSPAMAKLTKNLIEENRNMRHHIRCILMALEIIAQKMGDAKLKELFTQNNFHFAQSYFDIQKVK